MNFRRVKLPSGQIFEVPQGIQRIDAKSTRGWQVRYQGSKFFADGMAHDPTQAFANALHELIARIKTMPLPAGLSRTPSANKATDLPSGISGPIVRERPGRARTAELSVLLPRFGTSPELKKLHIGSENTYTPDRYLTALARAMELREEAIERYELATAKARRADVAVLKARLAALRR